MYAAVCAVAEGRTRSLHCAEYAVS